jgi:hypothetical protein
MFPSTGLAPGLRGSSRMEDPRAGHAEEAARRWDLYRYVASDGFRSARFGPTTPKHRARDLGASVDKTDARKATVRRFGRSDRSRIGQQVEGHAGCKSCCPVAPIQASLKALRRSCRRAFSLRRRVLGHRGSGHKAGWYIWSTDAVATSSSVATACWATLRSTRPSEVVKARSRCAPMSNARLFAAIPRLISSHRNHVATYRPGAHGSGHPPMTGPLARLTQAHTSHHEALPIVRALRCRHGAS